MFDTIKIFTKCELNLKDISNWHLIKKDLTMYLYRSNNLILHYFSMTQMLLCTFSAPKIIYGDNSFMIYEKDLSSLSQKVTALVRLITKTNVKEIRYWNVSRIDFCYNFQVKSDHDKKFYINAAKKFQPIRMKSLDFKTGAFFYNSYHSFKLYDKSAEIESRNIQSEEWQKKIIRFEISWRRKKIVQQFGNEVKLEKLFRDNVSKNQIEKYLEKIRFNFKMKMEEDLYMIIDKSVKKPNMKEKLKYFLHQLNLLGEKVLKTIISKNTFNRWIQQLERMGIHSFVFLPNFILPINFIIRVITCSDKVIHIKHESCIKTNYYYLYIRDRGS